MRPTGGQYFRVRSPGTGNAPTSREYARFQSSRGRRPQHPDDRAVRGRPLVGCDRFDQLGVTEAGTDRETFAPVVEERSLAWNFADLWESLSDALPERTV